MATRRKTVRAAAKPAAAAPATLETAAPTKRAESAIRERRRRKGMGFRSRLKLSLPAHLANDKNYRYYWLLDRPGRAEELTKYDDYDFVEDKEAADDSRNTGLGTRIERHAGADDNGKPLRYFLVRKPIDFHNEDKAERRQERRQIMKAIERGQTPSPEGGAPIHADGSYVPSRGITIHEGGYQP